MTLYVVRDPGPLSTRADCVAAVDSVGLARLVIGTGSTPEEAHAELDRRFPGRFPHTGPAVQPQRTPQD